MIELIGYFGIVLVVCAYYWVASGKVKGDSYMNLGANTIGALAVGANVYYHEAYASFALQCIWFVLSTYGIVRKIRSGKGTWL